MVRANDEPDRPGDRPADQASDAGEDLPFDLPGFEDEMGDGGYDPLDPDADCFKPPAIPTEVHCLHCNREYESYLIEWRVKRCHDGTLHGFWCCPTPGCGGAGFGFDLLPTDPEYVGEDGEPFWSFDEDEDDEEQWEDAELDGEDGGIAFGPGDGEAGRQGDPLDDESWRGGEAGGADDDIPF